MPRQDGTGPEGKGALTGRGLGPCVKKKRKTLLSGKFFSRGGGLRRVNGRRNRGLRD